MVEQVVMVAGRRGAGKSRWLQARVGASAGIVVMEEGRTRWESFRAGRPGLVVEKLFPSCNCCPGIADLPAALCALAARLPSAAGLFVELPAVCALGQLAECERLLPGWGVRLVWLAPPLDGAMAPHEVILAQRADESIRAK